MLVLLYCALYCGNNAVTEYDVLLNAAAASCVNMDGLVQQDPLSATKSSL